MKIAIRIFGVVGLLVAAGFGLYQMQYLFGNNRADDDAVAFFTVTRRALDDRVVERGTVESQKTVYGKCEVPGDSKIISIVPEGTAVKKGDVVVTLEADELENEIKQKMVEVNDARGKLADAKQALEIQLNKNESDVATAQLDFDLAEIDLEKYQKGDFVAEVADLERAIKEAEAELEKVSDDKNNVEFLVKKGYRTPQQLREYELQENRYELQIKRDQQKLKVLVTYDRKRKLTEFSAKAKENKLKLARAIKTAEAEKKKAESAVKSNESSVEILEEQLAELQANKEKCSLKAEQDGTVAYANERWYDPSERIREGLIVYSGRDIYFLPDMSKMQVKAIIHESVIDRIQVGQKAMIRLEAFSDTKLYGTVSYVAGMAASSWSSVQNYEAIVLIEDAPAKLEIKPGMTAEVDITIGVYPDVLAVPVGAITEHFEQSFAYVKKGEKTERRIVKTGRMTHSFIEIVEGLSEGEQVALDAYQRGMADFAEAEREAREESPTASADLPERGP